jgi:hypothetical protein
VTCLVGRWIDGLGVNKDDRRASEKREGERGIYNCLACLCGWGIYYMP